MLLISLLTLAAMGIGLMFLGEGISWLYHYLGPALLVLAAITLIWIVIGVKSWNKRRIPHQRYPTD